MNGWECKDYSSVKEAIIQAMDKAKDNAQDKTND
jgi:hypothetical protein